jgi:hypothetical protein
MTCRNCRDDRRHEGCESSYSKQAKAVFDPMNFAEVGNRSKLLERSRPSPFRWLYGYPPLKPYQSGSGARLRIRPKL